MWRWVGGFRRGRRAVVHGAGLGGQPRPLHPVGEGAFASGAGGLTMRWASVPAWSVETSLTGTVGRWDGEGSATVAARVEARLANQDITRKASLAVEAGAIRGTLPDQLHFFLGGRGTLPGHPFRPYGGRRFVLARGQASLSVAPTWLTARLVAGAGAVGATPGPSPTNGRCPTDGLRGYLGPGCRPCTTSCGSTACGDCRGAPSSWSSRWTGGCGPICDAQQSVDESARASRAARRRAGQARRKARAVRPRGLPSPHFRRCTGSW